MGGWGRHPPCRCLHLPRCLSWLGPGPARETEYSFLSRTEGLGPVEVAERPEKEAAAAAAAAAGSEAAEVVGEAVETLSHGFS